MPTSPTGNPKHPLSTWLLGALSLLESKLLEIASTSKASPLAIPKLTVWLPSSGITATLSAQRTLQSLPNGCAVHWSFTLTSILSARTGQNLSPLLTVDGESSLALPSPYLSCIQLAETPSSTQGEVI